MENNESKTEDVTEETTQTGNLSSDDETVDLLKKCEDFKDKWQRALADYDNFRKRTVKEKAALYDDGVRDAVEKLLPSIDNFERALVANTNKADGFYKGVEMIYRQLLLAFNDLGVDAIESVGEKFDPTLHNAVSHVTDEKYGENEIIEELQKGYICKDKVIRHSMVKVAN